MALFGSMGRRRNPWDIGSNGIVATPEQEEESRRMAGMPSPDAEQTPQQSPQAAPQGFWQGGGKFGVRDGLAAALAAVGDAFAQQGGGRGGAVQMLAGGRMDAIQQARDAEAAQMQRRQSLEDYEAKKGIDQRYATPNRPAIAENYDFIGQTAGPEAAKSYVQNFGDPMVTVPLGNGRVYNGPRSGLAAAMGGQVIGSTLPNGWSLDGEQGGPASAPGGFPWDQ